MLDAVKNAVIERDRAWVGVAGTLLACTRCGQAIEDVGAFVSVIHLRDPRTLTMLTVSNHLTVCLRCCTEMDDLERVLLFLSIKGTDIFRVLLTAIASGCEPQTWSDDQIKKYVQATSQPPRMSFDAATSLRQEWRKVKTDDRWRYMTQLIAVVANISFGLGVNWAADEKNIIIPVMLKLGAFRMLVGRENQETKLTGNFPDMLSLVKYMLEEYDVNVPLFFHK